MAGQNHIPQVTLKLLGHLIIEKDSQNRQHQVLALSAYTASPV